ncbi:hypothetical protein HYY72_04510 [Candidatus Woesearchaeota archaeon]|nr:hypothetical protein [Candidatus Woesearchaeota archaeon]
MKKGARAMSQVDWIVSLGIFLIYLAWFFLYVRPLVSPPVQMDSLVRLMQDKFIANTTWTIDTVPLIIYSNISQESYPIIADMPFGWNDTSFSFTDNTTFLFDSNKILLLRNMSKGKNVMIAAHSTENYGRPTPPQQEISAAQDSVSTAGIRADFKDSVLSRISYKDSYIIQDFNLTINSMPIPPENITTTRTSAIAAYGIQAQLFNHSSYVFAGNPAVYSIIRLNKPLETQQNLSINAIAANLTSYYTDISGGQINFSGGCRDFSTNYLDIYDQSKGISLIFREEANISLCPQNYTLSVKASFTLKDDIQYQLIMHTGDYNSTLKYRAAYTSRFGMIDKQAGLSARLINRLNSTNYSAIKTSWGYPPTREFSYAVLNSTDSTLYSYEPLKADPNSNVFARQQDANLLDQYGNLQRVRIRVKGW